MSEHFFAGSKQKSSEVKTSELYFYIIFATRTFVVLIQFGADNNYVAVVLLLWFKLLLLNGCLLIRN